MVNEAEKSAKSGDISYANRYLSIARRIGMRYNIGTPGNLRKKFCRKCKKYLYPGLSSEEKEEKGFLKIKCLNCSKIMQYIVIDKTD